jgi:hypothetical protein
MCKDCSLVTADWSIPNGQHFSVITELDWDYIQGEDVDLKYKLVKFDNKVFMIFKCTEDDDDWRTNLDYYPEKIRLFKDKNIYGHGGIYAKYMLIRNTFLDMCYLDDVTEIYISGFSLGGGLTKFAAQDCMFHFPTKSVKALSYEGPRVFCPSKELKKMQKEHKKLDLFHVFTFWDPVVHCVPMILPEFLFRFWIKPFQLKWTGAFNLSFWTNYGKRFTIGKWYKLFPIQHLPSEVEKNLIEKVGY